jgi:phage baseplate assembly protein W
MAYNNYIDDPWETFGDFEIGTYPTKTYKLHYESGKEIYNNTEGIEAVKQAVFKILNTDRYENLIYSWNYGVELNHIIGKPLGFATSEIDRVITEALTQDDRIDSINNFTFNKVKGKKNIIEVSFTVNSIFGEFKSGSIVQI